MEVEMKIFQNFDPIYLRLQYEMKLEEFKEKTKTL
jgi:hypothetical protein